MIFTIFKKELLDTLRDRRTLITMIVVPMLVFPVIMMGVKTLSTSMKEKILNKELKIGVVSTNNNYFTEKLQALPEDYGKKKIVFYTDSAQLKKDILSEKLDAGFFIPENGEDLLLSNKSMPAYVYYLASKQELKERLSKYTETIKSIALQERLIKLNITQEQITPIKEVFINIAPPKQIIGELMGGFLPYLFVIFGFTGCMYPAIDLFTGEKERKTLETLLTAPVTRWQILLGKMGVVALSGFIAAIVSLLGIYITVEVLGIVEEEKILELINEIISLRFIALLVLLLIPLVIFFAGIMIPIAMYAKSFKEAQSIITPLNIIILLPAMTGLFPGIELNYVTASIPILNISLATKELIAGTLNPLYLIISFVVMVLIAIIAVFIAYRQFDNEKNILG